MQTKIIIACLRGVVDDDYMADLQLDVSRSITSNMLVSELKLAYQELEFESKRNTSLSK